MVCLLITSQSIASTRSDKTPGYRLLADTNSVSGPSINRRLNVDIEERCSSHWELL